MVDPSLCREVTCCGAFIRRGSTRFQTSALALLCVLSALPAFAEPTRGDAIANEKSRRLAIASALTEASNRFRLPVHWLRAVIRAESGGDAKSISSKGAIGLMQLMPATYAELRTRYGLGADPFDPRDNILAGAAYLRSLLDQYGEHGFLAAYNAGPGRYEDYLHGRSLPAETTEYVRRIAPALSLGGISAAPYSASSGNGSSSIFVAITAQGKHDDKPPRYSADAALGAEGSTRRSLIPARIGVRLFATDLHTENSPDASSLAAFSRSSDLFAVRGPSGASR
ncbi:MAG: lytic transglycosylase domain-containing protein [Alphaproteobacteria bacterium]|nr:lytic transglycosylase domain-containing protein [Alphaproteobacteria bacterium]MBM3653338.1 lytic transglycosylase domain-containing protein [Alphaproteobacteria bacterium]